MKSGIIKSLQKIHKHWDWKRISSNIKYLIKNDLRDEWYRLKDETIEDCIYEFDELNQSLVRLTILNEKETIRKLKEEPKSYARFGDGEIGIIQGRDMPFQNYYPELANKMVDILRKKRENLYVGLNASYFQSPVKYREKNRKFYRQNGTAYRRFFVDVCDPDNTYLDAGSMGGYFKQKDDFDLDAQYREIRSLFENKKIAVVCGEGILDKLEYDLFDLCSEKITIGAPKVNAFASYNDIVDRIKKEVPKDYVVCIILGMTATVLAADLADEGYIAWDIGHAPKEYDYYMRGVEKTDEVIEKFFAPD